LGQQFYSEHAELGSETESRLSDSRRSLVHRQESAERSNKEEIKENEEDQSVDLVPINSEKTPLSSQRIGYFCRII
jgi:hypothetical protein